MDSKEHRKAKVTPESEAESARLRAIWNAAIGKPTQAIFGEKFGIGTQPAVGSFLNGKTPLSLKAAQGFAKGLNCEIADFSPRLAALAAGIAASIDQEPNGVSKLPARTSKWPFTDELLRRLASLSPEVIRLYENQIRGGLDMQLLPRQQGNAEGSP